MERNKFTKFQEEWLTLMESGEWRQTKAALMRAHVDDESQTPVASTCSYCCLGLAMHKVLGYTPVRINRVESTSWRLDGAVSFMSFEAMQRLDLHMDNGAFRIVRPGERDEAIQIGEYTSLADMNDSNCTFAQIAAHIRAWPWSVFTNFDHPEKLPMEWAYH